MRTLTSAPDLVRCVGSWGAFVYRRSTGRLISDVIRCRCRRCHCRLVSTTNTFCTNISYDPRDGGGEERGREGGGDQMNAHHSFRLLTCKFVSFDKRIFVRVPFKRSICPSHAIIISLAFSTQRTIAAAVLLLLLIRESRPKNKLSRTRRMKCATRCDKQRNVIYTFFFLAATYKSMCGVCSMAGAILIIHSWHTVGAAVEKAQVAVAAATSLRGRPVPG